MAQDPGGEIERDLVRRIAWAAHIHHVPVNATPEQVAEAVAEQGYHFDRPYEDVLGAAMEAQVLRAAGALAFQMAPGETVGGVLEWAELPVERVRLPFVFQYTTILPTGEEVIERRTVQIAADPEEEIADVFARAEEIAAAADWDESPLIGDATSAQLVEIGPIA